MVCFQWYRLWNLDWNSCLILLRLHYNGMPSDHKLSEPRTLFSRLIEIFYGNNCKVERCLVSWVPATIDLQSWAGVVTVPWSLLRLSLCCDWYCQDTGVTNISSHTFSCRSRPFAHSTRGLFRPSVRCEPLWTPRQKEAHQKKTSRGWENKDI